MKLNQVLAVGAADVQNGPVGLGASACKLEDLRCQMGDGPGESVDAS